MTLKSSGRSFIHFQDGRRNMLSQAPQLARTNEGFVTKWKHFKKSSRYN